MKKMRNLMTITLAIAMSLQLFTQCRSGKTDNPVSGPESGDAGKITYLLYMRQGMRGNVEKKYEMQWEKGENRYNVTFENYDGVQTAFADATFGDEISEILRQGKVHKYKNYYDPGPNVLDGWTWRFRVKYSNGASVESGGRIRKPSDFSGVERTEARLKELFE